jgi:hypothetical protein
VKKIALLITLFILLGMCTDTFAQCSICTKTAQQLGDKPANGLNLSIFFLAFTPLILIGIIWYRWRKNEKLEGGFE